MPVMRIACLTVNVPTESVEQSPIISNMRNTDNILTGSRWRKPNVRQLALDTRPCLLASLNDMRSKLAFCSIARCARVCPPDSAAWGIYQARAGSSARLCAEAGRWRKRRARMKRALALTAMLMRCTRPSMKRRARLKPPMGGGARATD